MRLAASLQERRGIRRLATTSASAVAAALLPMLGLVTFGCDSPGPAASTVQQGIARNTDRAADAASPQTAAAEQPRKPGRPIATVNDSPIDRRELLDLLVESRGLPLLQQFVLGELARQELERRGLTMAPADIEHEYDLTLQAARYDGKDVENLTPARREQMIEDWTRTRGITRQELAVAMKRQAALRQLAQGRVKITDEMLQQEFKRAHGEKVEVRHIQLAALRAWEQVKHRLDQGESFETLVRDYSRNALSREKNGLLPPFSADSSDVPAAMVKAAFALQSGQVSNPIEAEGSYHVLKLERRIPPEDVPFDEAKPRLEQNLKARLVAGEMERLGGELLMRARLRIEDPVLREQYKKRQAAGDIIGPPLFGQ